MSDHILPTDHVTAARIDLSGAIVKAYVSDNGVPAASLPGLIGDVHAALAEYSGLRYQNTRAI